MDVSILVAGFVLLLAVVAGGYVVVTKVVVREVPDSQRAAVFRGGSFLRLAGPGRTTVLPMVERAVMLTIGDEGTALVEGRAQFGGADIPVRSSAHLESGERVHIIGFDREEAAVVLKAGA